MSRCTSLQDTRTNYHGMYQRMCCCMIHTAVHIYCCVRTRREGSVEMRREVKSVPTHVLLYGTYCCTHLLLRTYSASVGRGDALRGKIRHTGPALAWFGVPQLDFSAFFLSAIRTLPSLWHSSAYLLHAAIVLLYYRTHILASWVVDGCFLGAACCPVLRLYYVLL